MDGSLLQARTSAKSPSDLSGSSALSSCPSSRDSSPSLPQLSPATSPSGKDPACRTPDSSGQQELLSPVVMEHHNHHAFNSLDSLRDKAPVVEPVRTSTSSPRNLGFHRTVFPATSASCPANPRNNLITGHESGSFVSARRITSSHWRNTNIATSTAERDSFLLPPHSSASIQNYYPLYNLNRSTPSATATMSSSTSPPANTAPTSADRAAGSDHGSNNDNSPGSDKSSNAFMLAETSQALVLSSAPQQQVGVRGTEQTEMPYYAYCFDRGNGQYTRLIPADMLPALVDIPARQQGCVGMTVLPCPTGLAPNGRSSNLEKVFVQPVQQFPAGGQLRAGQMRDPIQSRIDTIIASSPAPEAQKRQKIYCDKWIHEGVCAFTQQGCKYKHEMPLDKDTQESLGLFQGLPVWWRKHQGEIASDQQSIQLTDSPPALPSAGRARGISGTGRGGFGGANRLRQNTWRSQTQARPHSGSVSSTSGVCGGVGAGMAQVSRDGRQQGQVAQFSSPFGPIAPPSAVAKRESETTINTAQLARSSFADRNPWATLKVDRGSSDDEDGGKLA